MQFFVEMNGSDWLARYIDFKRKIGVAVGKRVVYGHNARNSARGRKDKPIHRLSWAR